MPRQRRETGRRAKPKGRSAPDEGRARRQEKENGERHRSASSAREPRDRNRTDTPARRAQSRELRRLLAGIGAPEPAPFTPDPFQLEALAALEYEDVLVTAPTGSGKTWIAREEIRRLLAAGRRAWYTSPLKALTNSKYQEFSAEFGEANVGILTGDRKENADAPLLVGTTEVYRNQLFDAMREGREARADLVILDEAHYLADEERGHVWEEAIILTPPRVRLLLLSATVGNAEEFAEWMREVRDVRCGVVTRRAKGDARPVPLRAAFLHPDGELWPLLDERGDFNQEIARLVEHSQAERRPPWERERRERHSTKLKMPEMPPGTLLAALGSYNLLPAIVFLPTRRRCDEAASEAALARRDSPPERREARRDFLRSFVEEHTEVRRYRHWDTVIKGGVAAHHAGHLPAWKLAVETLMSKGLLDAIFATATVAAGVDFPARTVALTGVEIRTGRGWRSLSASEFQQMTGRAGRRGRDRVGFIVAAPGLHQDPQKIALLLDAPPDPLESQFRATYTTLLNLLDAFQSFAHVRDIAERSFAHRDAVKRIAHLERRRDELAARIKRKLEDADCALTADDARGLERLASARARLLEHAPQTRAELLLRWLDEEVTSGRVVSVGRGGKRLVFVTERRGGNFIGIREDGRRASLPLERVGRVYTETFSRDAAESGEAFDVVRAGGAKPLDEPRLKDARAPEEAAVALLNDLIDAITDHAEESKTARCVEALWSAIGEAEEIERATRRIEVLRAEVWEPFERAARVLSHFGYLDFAAERVTERGRWLADLRVDRPLLVGEAMERGLFARLDPPRAAGLMAALASDSERDYGQLALDDALVTTLTQFDQIAYEVASVEWQQEIEPAPEINFSAAATAARWAEGIEWNDLARETRAEEGDLFRMLSRTGESLLQVAASRDTHPEAARAAANAAAAILREPVRTD